MIRQRKVAIDVTLDVQETPELATVATVERVRDGLGEDRTDLFRTFAAQEGFDLSNPDSVLIAAHEFAKRYASILP